MHDRLKGTLTLLATVIFFASAVVMTLKRGEFNDNYEPKTQEITDSVVPEGGSPNCDMPPLPDFGGPQLYFEEEASEYLPEYKPQSPLRRWIDVGVLTLFIVIGSIFFHRRAHYKYQLILMCTAALYFGFLRHGCICPVGATGHVAIAAGNYGELKLSTEAVLLFFIPLIIALFLGRVFCGSACPLGAIQAVIDRFAVKIPSKIDKFLKFGRFVILAWIITAGVLSMALPVCQYDPFVKFFRFSADMTGWIFTGSFLVICLTVSRPFCRFLCPYSVLLGFFSLIGFKNRRIIEKECVKCNKCVKVCPSQCIDLPKIKPFDCLACGKCSKVCPKDAIR